MFIGTDIDEKSFFYAQKNISLNGLQNRIKLLKTSPDGPLIPLDELKMQQVDFTLTNPPFYPSASSLNESAIQKSLPPSSVCTGSPSEMIYPGGETAFVSRIITESLSMKHRVQWYSSMLGLYSSISAIINLLKSHSITNYAVTEFIQGSRTRRWGIAWSFGDWRPTIKESRNIPSLPKTLLPFPSEYIIPIPSLSHPSTVAIPVTAQKIHITIQSLPIKWKFNPSLGIGIGFCDTAVWSRSARRKQVHRPSSGSQDEKMKDNEEDSDEETDVEEMKFGFKISISRGEMEERKEEDNGKVVIRWMKGDNSVIFESFCGMMKRVICS